MSFYIYETQYVKEEIEMTETNAERLEDARQLIHRTILQLNSMDLISNADVGNYYWLIKQAERARELEKTCSKLGKKFSESFNAELCNELKRKEEENKRLRESLEFYADEKKYVRDVYNESIMDDDDGWIARQALEGVTNDQAIQT